MEEIESSEKSIEYKNEEEPNVLTETICTQLLDALISHAITTSNINKVYSKLNQYCFNFMLTKIKPFLKTNFIFHETNQNNSNISHPIFFATTLPKKKNTWVVLKEPTTSKFDRYDSDKTKIINYESDIKNGKSKASSKHISNRNIIKLNITENKKENTTKFLNQYINRKDNKLNSMRESLEFVEKNNEEIKKPKKIIEKIKEKIKESKIEEENNNEDSKNKKEPILEDLSFFDLPEECYRNIYVEINGNEENTKLRLERERKRIFSEEQKKTEEQRIKAEQLRKLRLKQNQREFNSATMTFDPNGKIIYLKSPSIESIQNNDFFFSKQKITDKTLNKENLTLRESKKLNMTNKKTNSNFNKKTPKIKIEYNPLNKIILEEKKREKYIQSNQNIENIIPEIGVVIHEDNQKIKEGGFNFLKKYNKLSMNEFSKFILENSQHNLSSLATSNINDTKNSYFSDSENYNGYIQEFNDNNNPLFQGAHKLFENNKQNHLKSSKSLLSSINNEINHRSLIKNKSTLTKDINLINSNLLKSFSLSANRNKKKLNSINYSNNILLTKNVKAPNLLSYFDRIDELDNNRKKKIINLQPLKNIIIKNKSTDNYQIKSPKQNEILPRIKIKIKDLNNIKNSIKFIDRDYIDNFNRNIMKNKKWGSKNNKNSNVQYLRKNSNIFRRPFKINKNILEENGISNKRERVMKIDIGKL